jgi:hypothetical protein
MISAKIPWQWQEFSVEHTGEDFIATFFAVFFAVFFAIIFAP